MLVRMTVEGLLFDPRSSMYILLLKDAEGTATLPIWIGKPEADSIALALGKIVTPRPLTHDLIKNMAHNLKMKITRVAVTEILDNTFYALIYLNNGKDEISIDSRPSDAIAVALELTRLSLLKKASLKREPRMSLMNGLKILSPRISEMSCKFSG